MLCRRALRLKVVFFGANKLIFYNKNLCENCVKNKNHLKFFNFIVKGAQLKLQNKFSVGLQTLPIRGKKFMKNQASRFHAKMLEVKKYSDLLRNSPDYYVNIDYGFV